MAWPFRKKTTEPEERSSIDLSRYAQLYRDSFLGYSPVSVSRAMAMTHPTTLRCITQIATDLAGTPIDVVRKAAGYRPPVTPVPPLIANPSSLMLPDAWLRFLASSLVTDGNAFGEIVATSNLGYPTGIELINPELATDRRVIDGKKSVLINGERRFCWPHGDLWHCPGLTVDSSGIFGVSTLDRALPTIGVAIGARDFIGQFLAGGAHPSALITSETNLDEAQAAAIKAATLNVMKGNRGPLVLGSGLSWEQISADPENTQYLDLMKFMDEQVCHAFGMPPATIGVATSGQSVTYANVRDNRKQYLDNAINGLMKAMESALSFLLPGNQSVKFNRNAFMDMDSVGRSEVVDRRLKNKTMTVNQARALEDEPPFDGGEYDEPGIPGLAPPATDPIPGGTDA